MHVTPRALRRRLRRAAGATALLAAVTLPLATPASAQTADSPGPVVTGLHVTEDAPQAVLDQYEVNKDAVGLSYAFTKAHNNTEWDISAKSYYIFVEDTDEVRTYCVEFDVPFITEWGPMTAGPHSGARGADSTTLPIATWLARNATLYAPDGTVLGTVDSPDGDHEAFLDDSEDGLAWGDVRFKATADLTPGQFNDAEAAAVQLAIWAVIGRDPTIIDDAFVAVADPDLVDALRDRARELYDIATGGDGVGGALDRTIDPAPYAYRLDLDVVDVDPTNDDHRNLMAAAGLPDDVNPNEYAIVSAVLDAWTTVAYSDDPADPGNSGESVVDGVNVKLSVPVDTVDLDVAADGIQSETTLVTGAATGAVVVKRQVVEDGAEVPSVTITAQTDGFKMGPGVLMTPEDGPDGPRQQLITAEPAEIVRRAQAQVLGVQVTAPPDTQPEPPATTAAPPTELPFTGQKETLAMVAAVAGAGLVGFALLRRRDTNA